MGAAPPLQSATWLDDPAEVDTFTRWRGEGEGGRVAESSLRIGGMHCAQCSDTVAQALRRVPGVVEVQVSAASQCASVRWQPELTRPSVFVQALQAAGYDAVPDTAQAARAMRLSESRAALWRLFVAAFCAMQVMMLATPAYVSSPGELEADHKQLLDWGSWLLTLPVLWFSARPFFSGAWRCVKERRIGMDVPVALGMGIAFLASSGAAFQPGGPFGSEVYFDSLTMFVSFLLGARFLEMRARHRAEMALEETWSRTPNSVMRLKPDGMVEVVSAKTLKPGDLVRVPVGQAFAADGVLTEGETRADEALLTGESRPQDKRIGDALVAGSMNLGAPVLMRVQRVGADTRYEAIVSMVRAARTHKPQLLASADRWAGPFLWGVLLLAAVAGAAWSVVDSSRTLGVVVAVLIVTCPCALSLASPASLLAAAGAMGRQGLLLRRLDAIEALARVDTLFIDKTGTLTEASVDCLPMVRLNGDDLPASQLSNIAASLAGWSTHPIAAALRQRFQPADVAWHDVREEAGQGLQAVDANGATWRLGSSRWAGAEGHAHARSAACWLSRDGRVLARFDMDDRLRQDARQAIRDLQADGVHVHLLSGDDPARTRKVAAAIGLASSKGGLSPEDKLAALRHAQQAGQVVAMVGDGINDAPVLAQADVSFAMGEGAQIARTQADGVLVSNRLGDIVLARARAKKTVAVVRQNLAWAVAYNAACVPLAMAGWLPPWAAGLGMATSSLAVVLNAMRLSK
ncbi:heavy metal translocating P-type ATPase [Piscinibacter terrae]|uniref:Cadmium-translocating P-type ATPase n=1 Tax=Piscinibacter terrae TaxID=2496871 RepID=A0A3N7J1Y7_9BURK|nr:cation-translocating P-type ATPase [Albitalea terrae]RQP24942.1 cadmium-translocating P-type ATPase [Albitalea terrae]